MLMPDVNTAARMVRRLAVACIVLGAATALWLPALHYFFRPVPADLDPATTVAPRARALSNRALRLWEDPSERATSVARMRVSNAEWDFMGRTFLVLALTNLAEREPAARARYLATVDRIVDDTLAVERERGMYHFLMPYAHDGAFRDRAARSIFVDGEIALMLAARDVVERRPELDAELASRVERITAQMQAGPVLSGESYPDECWTFCNTTALAALRLSDVALGTDHSALAAAWVANARRTLLDRDTGMLVSSYRYDGTHLDGPEGSSIWMSAHNLLLVDPDFAREQYVLARRHLGRDVLGFGWAREWADVHPGVMDVDSGPIVPVLEASAGSSGLAILGARAFEDDAWLGSLLTSLDFAGFPISNGSELRYAAGNQVADAVLLYALTFGPLWDEASRTGGVS